MSRRRKASQPTTPTEAPVLLVDQPNKWRNWWTRTLLTFIMISTFLIILYSGHFSIIALVIIIQSLVYKEVISIAVGPTKMQGLPWMRSLHWHFLLSTNYFLYGESLIHYFKPVVVIDAFLMPLATHHRFISFSLYIVGLIVFVLKLKKGHYRFQFAHFCWTHMALLLIVVQSHFIINNIFEGLIWFVLPCSLVICNDIFAYIFGFFLGKTPLIRISPKKTWEGFMGGLLMTTILAFFLSGYLANFNYMTCSYDQWDRGLQCGTNKIFVKQAYKLIPLLSGILSLILGLLRLTIHQDIKVVYVASIQIHAIMFALFASLIAPFGGFFASGVKRAFKIKDFSETIPGHGGLTDRMDCQFIMGVFTSLYVGSFVGGEVVDVHNVMEKAVRMLDVAQLRQLYDLLGRYLTGQGMELHH